MSLRIIFPAVLLLLLTVAPIFAAPVVIDHDAVWSGTVELDDIVAVNAEATLTIRPGTKIRFARRAGEGLLFLVYGTVIAEGTAEQPILFTSAATDPRPGDWRGIYLEETREQQSLFRHCRIEFAEAALGGVRSKMRVANSRLRHNRTAYQGRTGLQATFIDCEILANETGFDLEKSGITRIENCHIADNRQNGIHCSGTSPEIRGNLIERNGGAGICCRNEASPVIEGNRIRGNGIGIQGARQVAPSVRHNEIAANDIGIGLEKMAFPQVERNVIRDNRIGIYCNLSSYPRLHGNNIVNNRELALDLGPNQSITVSRQGPFRERAGAATAGKILGPKTKNRPGEFALLLPEDGRIDARGNWWGEAALAELTVKGDDADLLFIEDAYDKPETEKNYPRDRFVYAPWATSPLPDAGLIAPVGPLAAIPPETRPLPSAEMSPSSTTALFPLNR
jgi:parallel beta-helix repeat protein